MMFLGSNDVVCPFFKAKPDRASYMRMPKGGFCDNLRSGIPLCVVSGFYEEEDEEFEDEEFERALMVMSEAEARVKFSKPIVESCGSVVLCDVYDAVKRGECFFGGLCVHPAVQGFGACTVDCSRWKV